VFTKSEEDCDGRMDVALLQKTLHEGLTDLLL
jgi:hypothetical protein